MHTHEVILEMRSLHSAAQNQILVFTLDEPRYALNLWTVERVVRAVEITPLPKAPGFITGVINVQGQLVTVVDVRQRLRLPARELSPNDKFILANTSRLSVALVVDEVEGIHELTAQEMVSVEQGLPEVEYIKGMVKLENGLTLICDLDQFLSPAEEQKVEYALSQKRLKTGGTP